MKHGGIASIAHPGKSVTDDRIRSLRDRGLDALEAFHPDHDATLVHHYVTLAGALGLLMTGGSDFHGDPAHGSRGRLRQSSRIGMAASRCRSAAPWQSGERLVELRAVSKDYRGLRPLRINSLELHAGQSLALLGFDQAMAEVLANLVTGAILPDTGNVIVMGRSTASINHADDWVETLDQFGLVSERAVLLDQLTAEQNLAMPLSLALDQLPDDVRTRVKHLANEVGFPDAALQRPLHDLPPLMRLRVRLGRALALDPRVLLAEHPNASLSARRRSGLRIRPLTRRRSPTHCVAGHHRQPGLCARRS